MCRYVPKSAEGSLPERFCPTCRYELAGKGFNEPCPECGTIRPELQQRESAEQHLHFQRAARLSLLTSVLFPPAAIAYGLFATIGARRERLRRGADAHARELDSLVRSTRLGCVGVVVGGVMLALIMALLIS